MDYPTLRTVRPRAKAIFYRLYGRTCATPHGFYDSQGFVGACNESMSRTLIYNQIYNRLLNKEMQKTIPCRCTFTSPEMPVRIPSARCPLHAKEIIQ